MRSKKFNKRGQLAAFVIIALVLVIGIIIYFLMKRGFFAKTQETPLTQIKSCANKYSEEAVKIISRQGGAIDPKPYYTYQETNIQYLCYTEEYYKTCVMQKPLIKASVEEEIKNYIKPKITDCINSVKKSLVAKGYQVEISDIEPEIEIIPQKIMINLNGEFVFTKQNTESYRAIKSSIDSSMYDILMITGAIQNYEARYGNAETMDYMFLYPNIKVQKLQQSDGTRIYIITERNTKDKFTFASKSLVWPVGYSGK